MTFAEELLWDLNPDILKSFFLSLSSCLIRGQPLNLFKIIIFETGFLIAQTSLETHCMVENEPEVLIFLPPPTTKVGFMHCCGWGFMHVCKYSTNGVCACSDGAPDGTQSPMHAIVLQPWDSQLRAWAPVFRPGFPLLSTSGLTLSVQSHLLPSPHRDIWGSCSPRALENKETPKYKHICMKTRVYDCS